MAGRDDSSDDEGSMEMYTGNNHTKGSMMNVPVAEMQHITNQNHSPVVSSSYQAEKSHLERVKSTESEQIEIVDGQSSINHTTKNNNNTILIVYKIVLHLLLIYPVNGATYLLFIKPGLSDNCKCPSEKIESELEIYSTTTTETPLFIESGSPTITPSINPTLSPTLSPSIAPSTKIPTNYPSLMPTITPTIINNGISIKKIELSIRALNIIFIIRKDTQGLNALAATTVQGLF